MSNEHIAEPLREFAVPVGDLHPHPQNARLHTERNLSAICSSLTRFGQLKPVVVCGGYVVAGNGTLRAASSLGWETIAAVDVGLDEEAAKAYLVADNRTGELADWDYAELGLLLGGLGEEGSSGLGFADFELGRIIAASAPPPMPTIPLNSGDAAQQTAERDATRDPMMSDPLPAVEIQGETNAAVRMMISFETDEQMAKAVEVLGGEPKQGKIRWDWNDFSCLR